MALDIENTFVVSNPADADYTTGSIKDATVEGANDGTKINAVLQNDYQGFLQKILLDTGITANNVADTVQSSQYLDGLHILFGDTIRGMTNTQDILTTDTTEAGRRVVSGIRTSQFQSSSPRGGAFWIHSGVFSPIDSGTGPLKDGDLIVVYDSIGFKYILATEGKPINPQAVGAIPTSAVDNATEFDLFKGSTAYELIIDEFYHFTAAYDLATLAPMHATPDGELSLLNFTSFDPKTDVVVYDSLKITDRLTSETVTFKPKNIEEDSFKFNVQSANTEYESIETLDMAVAGDFTSNTFIDSSTTLSGATNTLVQDATKIRLFGLPAGVGERPAIVLDEVKVGEYYECTISMFTYTATGVDVLVGIHSGDDHFWGAQIFQKNSTITANVNQVNVEVLSAGSTVGSVAVDMGDNNDQYNIDPDSSLLIGIHIIGASKAAVYVNRRFVGVGEGGGSNPGTSRFFMIAPTKDIEVGGDGAASAFDAVRITGFKSVQTSQTVDNPGVVIFGEDGTFGTDNNYPWPSLLKQAAGKLPSLGEVEILADFSGAGENADSQSASMIANLGSVSPTPDVVVVCVGHNDAINGSLRFGFEIDLTAMVSQVTSVMGPEGRIVFLLPWYTADTLVTANLAEYIAIIQSVVGDNSNATVVDSLAVSNAFKLSATEFSNAEVSGAMASAAALGISKALADFVTGDIEEPDLFNDSFSQGVNLFTRGTAVPSAGFRIVGDYHTNILPLSSGVAPNRTWIRGWLRVLSGTGAVVGTDWIEDVVKETP